MEKVIINSYEEFEKLVGQQIGVSDYVELSQERINLFADATLDHQWIHVDTERAKVDSPYHSTIAHGYLTLSMLPYLWNQIIQVNNLKMMINYGMDKMKFGQAVLSGQSIRLVTTLHSLTNLRGVAKAEIKFAIEIKDQPKKALEGIAVFLYFNFITKLFSFDSISLYNSFIISINGKLLKKQILSPEMIEIRLKS